MTTHILLAGGAGFIGSHIAKTLHRNGLIPVTLDNLSTGHRSNAERFGPFHQGSMEDAALVRHVVETYGIESAILLSAHAYVGESTRDPRKYYSNNVAGTIAFLNALTDCGVSRLIFSSSCSIYGIPERLPITEDSLPEPLSPYAESKYFAERMIGWYGKAFGLRSVCLRYFNAAGADPEGELGEDHDPETHMIPLAILAAMGKGQLTIFGSDYPTSDGTAVRDYVHVTDLAEGHLLALRYLEQGAPSGSFNLGAGRGVSNLEVIRAVEAVSGAKVPYVMGPRREGDAPSLVASPALAEQTLGWKARHSSIEEIVETAWKWFRASRTGD